MRRPWIEPFVVAAAALALGADTAYAPEGASGWNARYRAVTRELPPGAPHGTVELASFGTVGLAPEDAAPMTALHVRFVIHNASDEAAWSIALDTTTLELGDARIHPTIINSDIGTLPIAIVDRTVSETADLYFALPAGSQAPARFAFAWRMTMPSGVVEEHTVFALDPLPPPARSDGGLLGRGRRWWCDPSYPWPSYSHRDGILVPRTPAHVLVVRPPTRH